MTFAVETQHGTPGKHGVRIEEMVHVTDDGAELPSGVAGRRDHRGGPMRGRKVRKEMGNGSRRFDDDDRSRDPSRPRP